ncbi:hypothetical protein [Paraburkholderia humisilvae]|nr:hypothetical protein [Paraburkholderia humisilvae]
MNEPDGRDDENAAQDGAGRDWEGVEAAALSAGGDPAGGALVRGVFAEPA